MRGFHLMAVAVTVLAACQPAKAPETASAPGDFSALVSEPKTIAQLNADISSNAVTVEAVTKSYLDRIAAVDDAGPKLNAVLAINPNAIANAQSLDSLRKGGVDRGPLHGIPILLKDNIETSDPMPTTAGSLALQDNLANRTARWLRVCAPPAPSSSARRTSASGRTSAPTAPPPDGALSAARPGTRTFSTATRAARHPARAPPSPPDLPPPPSAQKQTARSSAPPPLTALSASSPPSASCRAPTSCRSAPARTRPAPWRSRSRTPP
jgi:hypothetical protein